MAYINTNKTSNDIMYYTISDFHGHTKKQAFSDPGYQLDQFSL